MREIRLADGRTYKGDCLSCSIVKGEIEPTGGTIFETPHFHAHQDVAYPVAGLVILASKRHVKCLDELTEAERVDYIHTLCRIRKAQREMLGIDHVYYFYNEDTSHHFHTWMVPRYDWMDDFGRSVESVRPVLLHAREKRDTEEEMNRVLKAVIQLRDYLNGAIHD